MRLLFLCFFLIACNEKTLLIDTPEHCEDYDRGAYLLLNEKPQQKYSGLPVKASCLYAPDKISRSYYRVIHSFRANDLKRGEFLEIDAFQQVTNDTPKPLMVSWYWVQGESPDSIDGVEGFRPLGENTDDYIVHHLVTHSNGAWEIKDPSLEYFNLVLFSASGEKNQEGDWLGIDRGYNNFVIRRD